MPLAAHRVDFLHSGIMTWDTSLLTSLQRSATTLPWSQISKHSLEKNSSTGLQTPMIGQDWMCVHRDSGGTSTMVHFWHKGLQFLRTKQLQVHYGIRIQETWKREEALLWKEDPRSGTWFIHPTSLLCSGWDGHSCSSDVQEIGIPPGTQACSVVLKDHELDSMPAELLPVAIGHHVCSWCTFHIRQSLPNNCPRRRPAWLGGQQGQDPQLLS